MHATLEGIILVSLTYYAQNTYPFAANKKSAAPLGVAIGDQGQKIHVELIWKNSFRSKKDYLKESRIGRIPYKDIFHKWKNGQNWHFEIFHAKYTSNFNFC